MSTLVANGTQSSKESVGEGSGGKQLSMCVCVFVGGNSRERATTGSYPEKNRNDPGMDFLGAYFLLGLKIHFQSPEGCPRKQEEQGESPVRMANPFPAFPSPSSGTASFLKPQPWASEDSLKYVQQPQRKSRSTDYERFPYRGRTHRKAVWRLMSAIPALGRWKQKDQEFKACVSYTEK